MELLKGPRIVVQMRKIPGFWDAKQLLNQIKKGWRRRDFGEFAICLFSSHFLAIFLAIQDNFLVNL